MGSRSSVASLGTRESRPAVVALLVVVGLVLAVELGVVAGWPVALIAVAAAVLGVAGAAVFSRLGHRERFDAVSYLTNEVVIVVDAGLAVRYVSPSITQVLGYSRDEYVGLEVADLLHPDDLDHAGAVSEEGRQTPGGSFRFTARVRHKDGSWRWMDVAAVNRLDDPGVEGVVSTLRDITERREAELSASRFQSIIESTPDVVVITDAAGTPLYLNPAARKVIGVADDVLVGELDPARFFTPASLERIVGEALPAIECGGTWSGELELAHADGHPVAVSHVLLAQPVPGGAVEFYASVSRDMTAHRELEAALQHQAHHDELTGLPNRKPLIAALEEAVAVAGDTGEHVAVLFLDVDRFKVVNDSLGHHTGDDLIVAFAERLLAAVRPGDRAGRFGGDEFVVICPGVRDADELRELADAVRRDVGGAFHLDGEDVFVSVSVGAALSRDGTSAGDLLRDADAAMYAAKAAGRDQVRIFDGSVRRRVVERLEVERELRRALERDELLLHFQPVVDLPSGRVRGVEALVRWRHPQRGLLLPDQFLPVAEETGLIVELGTWVLHHACAEAPAWGPDVVTGEPLPVYINLSPRQLIDANLVGKVREVIDLTGVQPAAVHFEITEHALLADATTTRSTLHELRDLGVKLALDDFGTGYSSLAYLKHFPVDMLKIDKTFVEGLGDHRDDAAITAAIVDVAQRLGLVTVAEGVESIDQAEWLTALGCDLAQGFHYARPMGASELRGYLVR